jgi:hypothetical protein
VADKYIESRGVRITVNRGLIKVEAFEEPAGSPYGIEVWLEGQLLTRGAWDPRGHAFKLIPPMGTTIDLPRCDVIVKSGSAVVCQWKSGTKTITVQCGWMKCVACSDTRLYPGRMWVGKDKLGFDEWVDCPECRGTARVPQYKHLNPETGLEIDYERQAGELAIA